MKDVKILLIDDERLFSDSIREFLESQDYIVDQAFDFNTALMKSGVYDYDCVLLDLMLPGGNGLDILRAIRKRHTNTGVIIISAKDSLDDKLAGLEIGADDYLPKPFALPELSMRIYALIRRLEFNAHNTLTSGDIVIDLPRKSACANGKPLDLTRSEYHLLLFFIANKGKVLPKAAIAEHLSGEMADMMDSYDFIYSHIKNLKAKLKATGATPCIRTVYGMGYRWEQ